jgi:hypothetical protein
VRAEPARLNSAIASLFMLGASCFALGAIPAYVHAVGANADAMTFFVGSIFFTSASYCQLVQAQSPGMTGVDEQRQDTRIQALGVGFWRPQLRELTRSIAWLNMLGSVAFMASAIASFVLPSTDTLIDLTLANAGTFLGAMCFFVGAALMLPAWRASARSSRRP